MASDSLKLASNLAGGVALLIAVALCASGCGWLLGAVVEKPDVKVDGAHFDGLNVEVRLEGPGLPKVTGATAHGTLALSVYNPNNVSLPIEGIEYEVVVADHPAVKGETNGEGVSSLPARATTPMTAAFDIRLPEAARALGDALKPGDVPFKLRGVVRVSSPIGVLRVPYEASGAIPKKIPEAARALDKAGVPAGLDGLLRGAHL